MLQSYLHFKMERKKKGNHIHTCFTPQLMTAVLCLKGPQLPFKTHSSSSNTNLCDPLKMSCVFSNLALSLMAGGVFLKSGSTRAW